MARADDMILNEGGMSVHDYNDDYPKGIEEFHTEAKRLCQQLESKIERHYKEGKSSVQKRNGKATGDWSHMGSLARCVEALEELLGHRG